MGKPCPLAVAISTDPYLFMAASNSLPWGTSEYDFAGYVKGQPIEVITGPVTGLPIPAHAEIILEGEIVPPEEDARPEGPFGEFTGYYAGGERTQPVVHVQALYHRNDPIIHGDPPLKPPMGYWGAQVMGTHITIWRSLEQLGIPGVRGVYPLRAGGSLISVVSLKQHYAGHASAVGRIVSGLTRGVNHLIVIVDEDIDPSDAEDVLWAIATRSDPASTWEIHRDISSSGLDPTVSPERRRRGDFDGSRAIINACRPWSWLKDAYPVNRISDALRARTLEKWSALFQ
jgi:4-hydroxy-3-polyprenylbenzoate decarboxylase